MQAITGKNCLLLTPMSDRNHNEHTSPNNIHNQQCKCSAQ